MFYISNTLLYDIDEGTPGSSDNQQGNGGDNNAGALDYLSNPATALPLIAGAAILIALAAAGTYPYNSKT